MKLSSIFIAGLAVTALVSGCASQQKSSNSGMTDAQVQQVMDAAKAAEEAAKRAEVAAEKAEVIFHKSLQK